MEMQARFGRLMDEKEKFERSIGEKEKLESSMDEKEKLERSKDAKEKFGRLMDEKEKFERSKDEKEKIESSMDEKEARRQRIITEPIGPLLIRMAIPTMVGMLVSMIYNLTDTFWIGQLNDKSMTAAIGVVFSFVSIIQALGFWFGYGSGNVMSRKLGEQDEKEARIISASGIVLAIGTGILLLLVCYPFADRIAAFIGGNASPKLLEYTSEYLKIMLIAVPFSLFSTTVYNQLRLCGNVKDGMIGLLVGMVSNIFLDPVFILVMKMEIRGAGLATLLGQVLGCVVLVILSNRHGNIPVKLKGYSFREKRLYHILAGGAPNFSRQGISSLAAVMLNQLAAPYGDGMLAALTVSSRVAALAYLLMIGFGQGFQPICAMNYGAKKYDRVEQAFRLTVLVGTIFLCVAGVLLGIFAEPLVSLFNKDPDVILLSVKILRFQCISFPFLSYYAVSSMYMQNIGKYFHSLMISIMRQGIVYIPLLYLLTVTLQELGICLVQPISDILSCLIAIIILGVYKKKSQIKEIERAVN